MINKEYVLDIETTGLDVREDRVTEIAIVELINKIPTKRVFHTYINPERLQNKIAKQITGLCDTFLAKQKTFAQIAQDLITFLNKDYYIVAHNAMFDWKFLNMELSKCSNYQISKDQVIDSLEIARELFPNQKNSLDALCKRFAINLDEREFHGALIDTNLLVKVYLKLFKMSNQYNLNTDSSQADIDKNDSCLMDSNVLLYNSADDQSHYVKLLSKIKTYE